MADIAITLALGVFAALAANIVSVYLDKFLSSHKISIKILGMTIELNGYTNEKIDELVDTIVEIQENPQVFLSYSQPDREFVQRLTQDLRTNGIKTWLSDEQISVGEPVEHKIQKGISESQWFIFVGSNSSSSASWTNLELELALKDEKRRRRLFVLPVLHEDAELPQEVKSRAYADFRYDYDQGLRSLLRKLKPPTEPTS